MSQYCFTIGHRESYLKGIKEQREKGENLLKLGKSKDYRGGYAFKKKGDAWAYIKSGKIEEDFYKSGRTVDRNDFSVFLMEADWEKDTYHIKGLEHNSLLKDCQVKCQSPQFTVPVKLSKDQELINECESGCLTYVEELVESGADPKRRGSYALQQAAAKGHLEVVEYLVEQGCDINKNLPAQQALNNGHTHVVKYLVSKGASVGTIQMGFLVDCDEDVLQYLQDSEQITDEQLEEATKIRKVLNE